ncbi:MAG: YceI family protein [Pseudomonadota bacterium]
MDFSRREWRRLAALLSALLLAACVGTPTLDPAELPSGEWRLDPGHTSVTWQVRHLGLSWYTARFDRANASLTFDPGAPDAAVLVATVDAASISTGDPEFDETLRGGAWLDAVSHAELIFRSTTIEVTGPTSGRVSGELTIKGVTRPAILETEFYGGVFNPLEGRNAIGFRASTTIDRTEFGVGRLPGGFISDEVRITIQAEFLKAR